MSDQELIERLIKIFEENGVFVDLNHPGIDLEMDSLQFVSLLVSLESGFDINIPDDSFSSTALASFSNFVELVKRLTTNLVV